MSMTKTHSVSRMSDEDWLTMLQLNHCIVRLFSSELVQVEYPNARVLDGIEGWLSAKKVMASD